MTPAEISIRNAIVAVEDLPGDVRLTDAVLLLIAAQQRVGDYVEGRDGLRTIAQQIPVMFDREKRQMPTDVEIDAAAKALCCPECDCIPAASYCAVTHDRDQIRRMLVAAERARSESAALTSA